MGLDRGANGSHSWEPVVILSSTWETPIWKANRRGNFMLTDEPKAHPWLFEDAGIRLEEAAAMSFRAVEFYDKALAEKSPKEADIRTQRETVWQTGRSLRSKGLHFLLTLAAQDARLVQADPKQFAIVSKRLEALLKKDLENQGGRPEMKQKLAEFQKDPVAWLKVNLAPREYETRTTIDWQRWIPRQE
jgi:hypothetical protein